MIGDEDEDGPPDGLCERCGQPVDMTEVDVESWEMTGKLLCPDCATDYPDVAQ